MHFEFSDKVRHLQQRLMKFMDENIYPVEISYKQSLEHTEHPWQTPPMIEELKKKARENDLWNLFMPGNMAPV